jgi:hypothetical protein
MIQAVKLAATISKARIIRVSLFNPFNFEARDSI